MRKRKYLTAVIQLYTNQKSWSKNYFSEKIWWTSEQICLFEWSTLYQWKTVLQIIVWKCWRTDAYCLHSHSGPGLSKIWLYLFKTTGKYCCFVSNDAYCLHSHSGSGLSKVCLYFFKISVCMARANLNKIENDKC